jgi:TPR repeat protein
MRIALACLILGSMACASAFQQEPGQPPVQGPEMQRMSDACKAGDTNACKLAALLYQLEKPPATAIGTEIVTKDMRRAAYYAGRGCALGEMGCCGLLANYYEKGEGVPRNEGTAVELHTKVCDGPVGELTVSSCASLGHLLFLGVGVGQNYLVPPDQSKGLDYLNRACSMGNSFGCHLRDRLVGTGRVSESEPPKGAMGFTFGWSSAQTNKACTDLQGKWTPPTNRGEGSQGYCELYVQALGQDVERWLDLCRTFYAKTGRW